MGALLAAALAGDDAAEFDLRDLALTNADAAEAYLLALQAGVSREIHQEPGRTSGAIVAVADQVAAKVRDAIGGWGHRLDTDRDH